ncbi:MAG TPA: alpha/beta hydrolase, partial [Kofleriaceae bacterium]|nr:alpha/beta hydrolase [Kofleriaceae bacterium]
MPAPGPIEPTQLVPIPTSNGNLHGEVFRPARTAKGIVVVTHGYAEHCGRYRELANVIAQAGWVALTYDVRGHGKSPGNRGFVASFHEYTDDLRAVIGVARGLVPTPAPLVLLGHSHGSLITLRAACEGLSDAKALIVSSPYLALGMKVPGWKKLLAQVASRIAPKLTQPNGIKAEQLTHDPAMRIAHDADPLNFPVATPRWFVESSAAQDYVAANAARITLPSTWIVGGADPLTDPLQSKRVAGSMTKVDYHELPGFL